ncbi:MAG TPA: hypothetical protein VMR76_03170 [Candidatus Saccharimonadia bacterium]|nr:hypothetical protein [Candidatus Saccharimonadia bacterium]
MEDDPTPDETNVYLTRESLSREIGDLICPAAIAWTDGRTYSCERNDEHDGEKLMHGGFVVGEWTNWTNSYLAEHPSFNPLSL